ncbi:uncharacterized protein LOC110987722 [Acanthaster planci]|uniref:Uncharacterized protein LOC110987722 n=1 Tax=Acanthaster planci TaxID=133434 RepID=A0A8B7ZLB5_ACAPL|nr:uncharacterized protein LOC110987722 [Acanthaster planci]
MMASGGGSEEDGHKKPLPDGITIVNHYHFVNSPLTFGISSGNTVNYGPEVRLKLEGPPELLSIMSSLINEQGENSSMSLEELRRTCDVTPVKVRKGCVELTLRVASQKGLEKLRDICNSGELKHIMGAEFPINNLRMVEEDFLEANRFFETEKANMKKELQTEVENFERAACDYVGCRQNTVRLLRELVDYITRRQRQSQAAAAAGAAGAALAVFTLGASLLQSAVAGGAALAIVAVIAQGVTAKISTDEAKRIMAKDKKACDRVNKALEKIELKLQRGKERDLSTLVNSIYDLVRVDKMNLKRGEDAIETIDGKGRGAFIHFVVIAGTLDSIIMHILDVFSADISKMAKKISEIADKLACPDEASMKALVSQIKDKFQLDAS